MEEMVLGDVSDFFANWAENKPNFIRMKSFLEGAIAIEKDEKTKQEMSKTLDDIEMYEGVAIVALQLFKKQKELEKKIRELKHETEKNHNNNLAKIVELEKRFDDLDAGK